MVESKKSACADCNFPEVSWAVINRGLFICEDCCSVHRSLGRHVSQLKSISNSKWRNSQLNMVQMLSAAGINSFWEHFLTDSKCTRKKPQPNDLTHPTKAEFIRAKHQELAFVLRSRNSSSQEDLDQQLHSSVRTSNLETSLRLLIHGADPNYYHNEKGNYTIHVAASAGQMEQVELLVSYGANPNVLDLNGNSATSCAKMNGHMDTADKLIECMYEVTDKFCNFLCNRKADHKNDQHFFVPEISECSVIPLLSEQARSRLKMLSNSLFEELVMDVYDEVDRRENELICRTFGNASEETLVPFLPVNPELSTMRNQGRQKLARLKQEEFVALIWDILMDANRRQNPNGNEDMDLKLRLLEEEPLYDSVASDDDYANLDQMTDECGKSIDEEDKTISCSVVKELRGQLSNSEGRISQLAENVKHLERQLTSMKEENEKLKSSLSRYKIYEEDLFADNNVESKQRPTSMYNIAQQFLISNANHLNERQEAPKSGEVLRKTDQVTKRLQELSSIMKSIDARSAFAPCAQKIRIAVADLSSIFTQDSTDEEIKIAVRSLNVNTIRLQAICGEFDTMGEKIRNCALNMAKATRNIVTHYQ